MSDQLVAETSTWQHTTLTTDKYPCPRWDSNPRFQQVSGLPPLTCWNRGCVVVCGLETSRIGAPYIYIYIYIYIYDISSLRVKLMKQVKGFKKNLAWILRRQSGNFDYLQPASKLQLETVRWKWHKWHLPQGPQGTYTNFLDLISCVIQNSNNTRVVASLSFSCISRAN